MRDKLAAIVFILIFLYGLINVAWYTYLAWFRSDQFPAIIKGMWPNWQRQLPFAASILRWMDSPGYLITARLTTLLALTAFIVILLVIARPVFGTLLGSAAK